MRAWGVDDWFRPKRWVGSTSLRRPAPTRRERSTAWVMLVVFAGLAGGIAAFGSPRLFTFVGGSVGLALGQVFVLVRTRHLSRFARRS